MTASPGADRIKALLDKGWSIKRIREETGLSKSHIAAIRAKHMGGTSRKSLARDYSPLLEDNMQRAILRDANERHLAALCKCGERF